MNPGGAFEQGLALPTSVAHCGIHPSDASRSPASAPRAMREPLAEKGKGGGGSISIARSLAMSGIRPTGCGRPHVLEREGADVPGVLIPSGASRSSPSAPCVWSGCGKCGADVRRHLIPVRCLAVTGIRPHGFLQPQVLSRTGLAVAGLPARRQPSAAALLRVLWRC